MKKTDTEYTYTYWITPSETIQKATHEVTTNEEDSVGASGGSGAAADQADKDAEDQMNAAIKAATICAT